MNNYRLLFLICLLFLTSCSIFRKPHINLPVKRAEVKPVSTDSSGIILHNFLTNNLDFNTLQLKFKISYSDTNNSNTNGLVIVRMRRDSVIWISVSASIGVEVMRVLITKDSVRIIDRLKKEYTDYDFHYLYQFIPSSVNMHTLQDIIVGNSVFIDSTNVTIKKSDTLFRIESKNSSLRITDYFGQLSKTLIKSMIFDTLQNVSVFSQFNAFTIVGGKRLASSRNYVLKQKERILLDIELKDVKINEPLTYPFRLRYK